MSDYLYIIAPVAGWIVAQSIKFVLSLRKDGIALTDAIQSGGMPSSHSAFMAALACVVALEWGISSPLFGVVFAITAIVAYDAVGVRRTTGEQTDAIVTIARSNKIKLGVLHDSRGHSVVQVIVGLVVGAVTGYLAWWLL